MLKDHDVAELSPEETFSSSIGDCSDSMPSGMSVLHGVNALETLAQKARYVESPFLHYETFITWLKQVSDRKMCYDEVFRARRVVLNLRRSNHEALQSAAAAENDARRQWELCHDYARYRRMEKEVVALQNTLHGIMKSKHPPNSTKYTRMMEVFESSTSKLAQHQQDMEVIENTTPEYISWKEARQAMNQLRQSIGLSAAEEYAQAAEKEQGSKRHDAGSSFESFAENVVNAHIIPAVASKHAVPAEQMRYVRNITLGMGGAAGSTAEIDGMLCICELCEAASEVSSAKYRCRVLGVVEVKRNAEDVASAFESYQKCLSWLCGLKDCYDAKDYTTKYYRNGHFDRTYEHIDESGDILLFSSASFDVIRPQSYTLFPDPCSRCGSHARQKRNFFVEDLYFVTKYMAIENVTSAESNFTVHSIGTRLEYDEDFLNEEAYEKLRQFILKKFDVSHQRITVSALLNLYVRYHLHNQLYVITWNKSDKHHMIS